MDIFHDFLSKRVDPNYDIMIENKRQKFVSKYNDEAILNLTQEQYCFAGRTNTFCYQMEYGLGALSSMGNAFPSVFGVYVDSNYQIKLSKHLEKMFIDNYDAAFRYQKKQIVQLINAARLQDYRTIERSDINQQFKYKIISIYCPDLYFPVCTRPTAEAYCSVFGIKCSKNASMLDLNLALVEWSNRNLPSDWDLHLAMWFCDCLWRDHKTYYSASQASNTDKTETVQKMPIKSKPATKEPSKMTATECAKLFPENSHVHHKAFGNGVVINNECGKVTIKFDNGEIKQLGVDFCIKNKLLEKTE